MAKDPALHPCLTCGACCATYRVSFHYLEMRPDSHGVPEGMSVQISPYQNAMMGTNQENPRCIALRGVVGELASCGIYQNRPNCCRIFEASFENGAPHTSCDEARAGKGLRALSPDDWPFGGVGEIKN